MCAACAWELTTPAAQRAAQVAQGEGPRVLVRPLVDRRGRTEFTRGPYLTTKKGNDYD